MSSPNSSPTNAAFKGTFESGRDLWVGNKFRAGRDIHIHKGSGGPSATDSPVEGDRFEKNRQALLDSLYFPEMDRRQDHIESLVDDFGLTCRWIVTPGQDHGFLEWLQSGSDVFWISGLPGTGKSTLIDFLSDNLQHNHSDLLANWAQSNELILLKFFFYSAKDSTKLQNTFTGLWRSLCFQILSDDRTLLPRIVADPSAPKALISRMSTPGRARNQDWFRRDLKQCLDYLLRKSDRKLLCLLDGLDECEDDHHELLQVIQKFNQTGMKICCAGRPDEPFRSAFRTSSSIHLHNINSGDIRDFCSRKLWDTAAAHLAEDIVTSADGVFLWAAIVTLDLRRAAAFSGGAELEARLSHCPKGMLDLYRHMGNRQNRDTYAREHPLPYLRIIRQTIDLAANRGHGNTSPVSLFEVLVASCDLEMSSRFGNETLDEVAMDELNRRSTYLESQILTRCAGLVHIKGPMSQFKADCFEITPGRFEALAGTLTQFPRFVHKTALEFLDNDIAGSSFLSELDVSETNLMFSICRALGSVLFLPWTFLQHDSYSVRRSLDNMGYWAPMLESRGDFQSELYGMIDRLLMRAVELVPCDTSIVEAMDFLTYDLDFCIYHQDLSLSENFRFRWIGRFLDVLRYLRWANASPTQVETTCTLILNDWWIKPLRQLECGLMSRLLSACGQKAWSRHTFFRYYYFSEGTVFLVPETLWCHYIAAWSTWLMENPKRLYTSSNDVQDADHTVQTYLEAAEWFLQSGASVLDSMHLTMVLEYANLDEGNENDVKVFPYTHDCLLDLEDGCPNDRTLGMVFLDVFMPPYIVVPPEVLSQVGHDQALLSRTCTPYISSCRLLGMFKHLPLTPSQSDALSESMLDYQIHKNHSGGFQGILWKVYFVMEELVLQYRNELTADQIEQLSETLAMIRQQNRRHNRDFRDKLKEQGREDTTDEEIDGESDTDEKETDDKMDTSDEGFDGKMEINGE